SPRARKGCEKRRA
ncbi:hypothetical protein CFC21_059539, partial [Triticum aestivum]